MEEILMLAKAEIRKCGQGEVFTFGIKLTGGGALLKHSIDLANNIFFQPVKLGKPNLLGGISENLNNPIYSTAVGLLKYSIANKNNVLNEKLSISNIFNLFKKIIKEIF